MYSILSTNVLIFNIENIITYWKFAFLVKQNNFSNTNFCNCKLLIINKKMGFYFCYIVQWLSEIVTKQKNV